MHSRFLASWRGVLLATVFASLIVASLSTAAIAAQGGVTPTVGQQSGGLGVVGEETNDLKLKTFPRTNYQWPFATGPHYGGRDIPLVPGVFASNVGTFDLRAGVSGLPAELTAGNRLATIGAQYFVLALDPAALADGGLDRIRESIAAAGGELLQQVPVAAYVARLTQDSFGVAQGLDGVLAVAPYQPAFKLNPLIGRAPLADPFKAQSEVYDLDVVLHHGENAAAAAAAIASMGANVLSVFDGALRVEIHRGQLAQVAGLESVYQVHEHLPVYPNAIETTNTMQIGSLCAGGPCNRTGQVAYNAAGIDGSGTASTPSGGAFVLMVLDSGLQLDNGDLSNTKTAPGTAGLAHRKVVRYEATNTFGGGGDLLGCDAPSSGAFTHGHTVSTTALGWATNVDSAYDPGSVGFTATDTVGNAWGLDGVAPKARLVLFDAEVTPAGVSCSDPSNSGLNVGNIYTGEGSTSSLESAYHANFARDNNFSWGATNAPSYGTNASRIDDFLDDHRDAMVFVSAGNDGSDDDNNLVQDLNSVSDPASCKNCAAIGSTGNANDLGGGNGNTTEAKSFFSSLGPATTNYTVDAGTLPPTRKLQCRAGKTFCDGRIAPVLMAPGQERGSMGVASEFSCRSSDNDQTGAVECDIVSGIAGTSFSSPAASGAALLVRDYFAKGFYPDGTDGNVNNASDEVPSISGALLKAVLIASADWVGVGNTPGTNMVTNYRANNEQGYGRIQLDNALPLQSWGNSAVGLIVADGDGTVNSTSLTGSMAPLGANQDTTITVIDPTSELRIALAWTEGQGEFLLNDLNLEVIDPNGKVYFGNYFTDDNDRSGGLNGSEDCPSLDGTLGVRDASPWSLATCANSVRDDENNHEAVFLSPDPDANGDTEDGLSQIVAGDWTVRIKSGPVMGSAQTYSVAIAGGVALSSSVRFDNGSPTCNDTIGVIVNETDEVDDPAANLTVGEVQSRLVLEVLDGNTVVDSEDGSVLALTQPDPATPRFVAEGLVLSSGTAADPGNGALDIFDGATLRVTYNDKANNAPDPNQVRSSTSTVDCSAAIGFGNLVFGRFGRDTLTLVSGGCERNARDSFEFGFPDQYIDDGETVGYAVAFFNDESTTLTDAVAELRCVVPDGDSPADCRPGSADCADPNRLNNAPCAGLNIVDSPKVIGDIPSGAAIAARFTIEVSDAPANTEVEMVLGVSSPASGKSTAGYAVASQVLDADELTFFYSTDFVGGGNQTRDYNNNEVPGEVTESAVDFFVDYRIEDVTWSALNAGGKNANIGAPWNFDSNNGNFTSGIGAISDSDLGVGVVVANWGEDKNFNNALDAGEDRDPSNGVLDRNWSTTGGCGWQTSNGASRGVWHTGRAAGTTGNKCLQDNGQCEPYEFVPGTQGVLGWFELLLTPVVEQVDTTRRIEHINWAWNMALQYDQFATLTWEFDTDTSKAEPVDLVSDGGIFNAAGGPSGPVGQENNPGLFRPSVFGTADPGGYPMFAPVDANNTSINGTIGNNRSGKNSCYFENQADALTSLGLSGPPDDDINQDGDGSTDEYVTASGPIRNFDLTTFNGPDMRFTTLEDIYGESGATFQGALGFFLGEDNSSQTPNPTAGFGVAIDDMVMEWMEIETAADSTNCLTGACAVISLDVVNFFEGSAVMNVTLTDKAPGNTAGVWTNDCNLDGTPDGVTDCDADGRNDVPVEVYSDLRADTEIIFLNENSPGSGTFRGTVSISAVADVDAFAPWNPGDPGAYAPGTLFVQRVGTDLPNVNVDYKDENDGTNNVCNNDVDPAARGIVSATTAVIFPVGRLTVQSVRVVDSGDADGYADTNETVNLFVTLRNNSGADLTGIVARLATNDSKIECIRDATVAVGDLADGSTVETPVPFVFKVGNVSRANAFADFSAKFTVALSADQFAATFAPEEFALDLDLNVATGGGAPTTFFENFDAGTFGAFTSMTLDELPANNAGSDGYRCQFNDPDGPNPNSAGNLECYLEHKINPFFQYTYDWHVHTAARPDGGRAFSGANSLHMGHHTLLADDDTTSLGQLDAVRTTNPIHLSNSLDATLSFKHQISIVDDRTVNVGQAETPDKGVVMVRIADNAGVAQGPWVKVRPYSNVYDRQGTDNYFECMFDPIDDGNNEDSFFDPSDPDRRLGPSSTCYPEFVFAYHGDTDYRNTFNVNAIGRASDGPGLQGNVDRGTWVQPEFNLQRFRGRSIFLRFLYTSIQVQGGVQTIEQLFDLPNGWPGDDGWYIDDVTITNAVTLANTTSVDNANIAGDPTVCSNNCTTLTADLTTDLAPGNTTPAPGHVIQLDATGSDADACINGVLQYAFWIDENQNNVVGDAGDTLLRDWTDDPFYLAAPSASARYGVQIRCSSAPSCGGDGDATVDVTVDCPASGNLGFNQTIGFNNKTEIGWNAAATIDAVRGNLITLRSSGSFSNAVDACAADNQNVTTLAAPESPAVGGGLYWLVRGSGGGAACNAVSTYSSGGAREVPDRDAEIGADPDACP